MSQEEEAWETFFRISVVLLVLSIVVLGAILYQEFVLHIHVPPTGMIKCMNATQCGQMAEIEMQTGQTLLIDVLIVWAIVFGASVVYTLVKQLRNRNK